jgi:hypothetical protein
LPGRQVGLAVAHEIEHHVVPQFQGLAGTQFDGHGTDLCEEDGARNGGFVSMSK